MSEYPTLPDALDRNAGRALVSLARATIQACARTGSDESPVDRPPGPDHGAVASNCGAFVTIERGERLRGCRGRPEPDPSTPLWRVVGEAAVDAARNDPRCAPVEPAELDEVAMTVTVLSPPTAVEVDSPNEYPEEVAVGRDGVVVRADRRVGLLLPQVAVDREWSADAFLTAACQKAGLPGTAWRRDAVAVERFTARTFEERRPRGAVLEHRFDEDPGGDASNGGGSRRPEPPRSDDGSVDGPAVDGGHPTGAGVRPTAVAGRFYARTEAALTEQLRECFEHDLGPGALETGGDAERPDGVDREEPPTALVSPHAGYPYSGPVAAHGFAALAGADVDTAVVLGPNHDGRGAPVAVSPHDGWRTPLGTVPVDGDLAAAIVADSEEATFAAAAHEGEHSIEVQLPFLQYCCADVSVVPICLSRPGPETARRLGRAIAGATERVGRDAVVVSSTDLTHYEPHERAVAADEPVVDAIAALDADAVARARTEEGHTMCGPWATVAGLTAARELGATAGEVLQYATSGRTGGERDRVVGYPSVAVR